MKTQCFYSSFGHFVVFSPRRVKNSIEVRIIVHDKYCNILFDDTVLVDSAFEKGLSDYIDTLVDRFFSKK